LQEENMLKWILIGGAVLAGLVGVVAIIGTLLPKGHVASRSVRLRTARSTVWQLISNFADQASYRADITKIERRPDQNGHEVWNEVRSNGNMPLETIESVPHQKLVRKIADPKMPFGGTWTFELADSDGGGCVLTVTENGEVYNVIFRAVSKLFDMRATIDAYLKAMGKKLGEDIQLMD